MKKMWWKYGAILVALIGIAGGIWLFNRPKNSQNQQTERAWPVTAAGITLHSKPAKIVSLSPGLTARMAQLAGSRMIACSDYCTGEATSGLTRVGSLLNPNFDRLEDLKPDLIITLGSFSQAAQKRLEQTNAKLVALNPVTTLSDWEANDLSLCRLILGNTEGKAAHKKQLSHINKQMNRCKAYTDKTKTGILWLTRIEEGAVTKDTLGGNMIAQGGFVNLATDTQWRFNWDLLTPVDGINLLVADRAVYEGLPKTQQAIMEEQFDAVIYFDLSNLEQQNMNLPEWYAAVADQLDALMASAADKSTTNATTSGTTAVTARP